MVRILTEVGEEGGGCSERGDGKEDLSGGGDWTKAEA